MRDRGGKAPAASDAPALGPWARDGSRLAAAKLPEAGDAGLDVACDGGSDDAPAIRAALAILSAARGRKTSTLRLAGPVCAIGSTLQAPRWSGIRLVGNGAGGGGRSLTRLKWIGVAGGTMVC